MRYLAAAVLTLVMSVWPARVQAQGAPAQPASVGAVAQVTDPGGRSIATVTFRETSDQVLINLTFPDRALTGTHGLQIHENGRCDPPDYATAGGIFNPFGKQHGLLNLDGPMAGDLPSLVIGTSGLATYNTAAPLVKLGSGGPASLLKPGGTSLLIYAQADDDRTQPEGGAGARIACGIIMPGPLNGSAAAQINLVSQSPTTSNDSRLGALIVALGGIVLIGVGVALRQRRLRL